MACGSLRDSQSAHMAASTSRAAWRTVLRSRNRGLRLTTSCKTRLPGTDHAGQLASRGQFHEDEKGLRRDGPRAEQHRWMRTRGLVADRTGLRDDLGNAPHCPTPSGERHGLRGPQAELWRKRCMRFPRTLGPPARSRRSVTTSTIIEPGNQRRKSGLPCTNIWLPALIILDGRRRGRPNRGPVASAWQWRLSCLAAEKHRNDAEQGEAGHDRRALREAAEISNQ